MEDKNKKALVVEDDKSLGDLLLEYLVELGFEVDVVSNGLKAVGIAREKDYDFCLMDINMPIMDGLEAIVRIKKEGGYLPIIAMSARVGNKKRCILKGANAFLRKPFFDEDLLSKMREVLVYWYKYHNQIIMEKRPMSQTHADELRELAKKDLCKMMLRGVGGNDVIMIVHKNVPFKISRDFVGNREEISVFLDRTSGRPMECHLYKSSCPMPSIFLTEEEFARKSDIEDKDLAHCLELIKNEIAQK